MKRIILILAFTLTSLLQYAQSPSLKIIECSNQEKDLSIDVFVDGEGLYNFYKNFKSVKLKAQYFIKLSEDETIIINGNFSFEYNGRELFCYGNAWASLQENQFEIKLDKSSDLITKKYEKMELELKTHILDEKLTCNFLME